MQHKSVVDYAAFQLTCLLVGDTCPYSDDIPYHTLRVPPDAAEDVEQYSKPALSLSAQEHNVSLGILGRYHVGSHGLRELLQLACRSSEVRLD